MLPGSRDNSLDGSRGFAFYRFKKCYFGVYLYGFVSYSVFLFFLLEKKITKCVH